jgi:uncharacterized RDD family membrane protein YckC
LAARATEAPTHPRDTTIEVVTPENIAFEYQLAGPFRRLPAYIVDLLVQYAIMFCIVMVLWFTVGMLAIEILGAFALGAILVSYFLISWFYGASMETYFNGRTVGKWMFGIRVIDVDGCPITGRRAITRNLLRVADLRARMENDRDGARAMLEAADELIAELDDLGLYPVRESIADALAALRARPVVDRTGLYLELESLADRIAAVPLDLPRFPAEAPSSGPGQGWLETLQDRLGGLFDFRVHRPEPVTPLMAPDQAFHLRHNLLLLLEQAQLALQRSDATVWEDTLGQAQRWIREYFDPTDPEIGALARALERLGQERVSASAPDISAPLNELRRLRGRAEAKP